MKGTVFQIDSVLSTSEIGSSFRSSIAAARGSKLFIAVQVDFYTPEAPPDPFDAIDDNVEPVFSVGAEYIASSMAMRGRSMGVLVLSVYELADRQQAILQQTAASGIARQRYLGPDTDAFLGTLKRADPNMLLSSWKERI